MPNNWAGGSHPMTCAFPPPGPIHSRVLLLLCFCLRALFACWRFRSLPSMFLSSFSLFRVPLLVVLRLRASVPAGTRPSCQFSPRLSFPPVGCCIRFFCCLPFHSCSSVVGFPFRLRFVDPAFVDASVCLSFVEAAAQSGVARLTRRRQCQQRLAACFAAARGSMPTKEHFWRNADLAGRNKPAV